MRKPCEKELVVESLPMVGVDGEVGFEDAFPRGMKDDIPPRNGAGP